MPAYSLVRTAPFGAFLLRISLASYWVIHWWYKVGFRGMGVTEAFFVQHGLPAWLAWFDITIEIFIAAALLFGSFVRIGALLGIPILIASVWIFRGNGFYFPTGGIELPLLWALAQVVQALLGPGAYALGVPAKLRFPLAFTRAKARAA